ncbi:hypothetical protein E4U43_001700 [Claviceps pusilla]|uniref:Uncharacterized protein n=1 Tax=Claviceps pusilla TaxID=123648 RepID=A0A9P7SZQ4_9HYPO|nr:hypothetical protein E4U43_001700 [Claviceps pusilla]
MKFTTVLGSLFFTALQVAAVPVDESPYIHLKPGTLDARDNPGYCCVGTTTESGDHRALYVPRGQIDYTFYPGAADDCEWTIARSASSCDGWRFELTKECKKREDSLLEYAVQPDSFCKQYIKHQ